MKHWSHLPNAPLIDWVIESLKCNPELWAAALNAALRAVRDGILNAAWNVARNEVRIAARIAAWNATDDATRNAARVAARDAAHGAILALIHKCGNFDSFVQHAIAADGRGHFLSSYDGEENEAGEFFVYRTN